VSPGQGRAINRFAKRLNPCQQRAKCRAGGSACCQKITPLEGKNRRGFGVQCGAQRGASWRGALARIRQPERSFLHLQRHRRMARAPTAKFRRVNRRIGCLGFLQETQRPCLGHRKLQARRKPRRCSTQRRQPQQRFRRRSKRNQPRDTLNIRRSNFR
jgi:hypothetical protein